MYLGPHIAILSLLLPLLALCDSLKPAKDLQSPWKYLGCFQDDGNNRLLPQTNGTGYRADGHSMTGDACVTFCASESYDIAGLEYGIQCFCARNFTTVPPPELNKKECDMACSGNAEEACGGDYKLTVYYNKKEDVQGAATKVGIDLVGLAVLVVGGLFLL